MTATRLLIDAPLAPAVAAALREAGYDVAHVRDAGLVAAADVDVVVRAIAEDRVLVSADADFGALLAVRRTAEPSVVLLRRASHHPVDQAALLRTWLARVAEELQAGAVVILEDQRVRIRRLPMV